MALVRVKRRLTDDPVDALLVTTKRLKKDDLQATLFQFAATVKKNEDAASIIKRVVNSSNVVKPNANVEKLTKKFREEIKNNSAANRLKVVNCFRSLDYAADGETTDHPLTVVEIEARAQEISSEANATAEPSTSVDSTPKSVTKEVDQNDYVIDLYYTSSLDICDSTVDNILSAIPLGNDVLFQDHYYDSNEECYGDDEDSNDENHWRNDYPDEEDDLSQSSLVGPEGFNGDPFSRWTLRTDSEEDMIDSEGERDFFGDHSSEELCGDLSSDEELSEDSTPDIRKMYIDGRLVIPVVSPTDSESSDEELSADVTPNIRNMCTDGRLIIPAVTPTDSDSSSRGSPLRSRLSKLELSKHTP